jgi:hypothetical protein
LNIGNYYLHLSIQITAELSGNRMRGVERMLVFAHFSQVKAAAPNSCLLEYIKGTAYFLLNEAAPFSLFAEFQSEQR